MQDTAEARLQQLATTLEERREELGLSAREVARRADVDVMTYRRLEKAEHSKPSTSVLEAVAEALDLPVSDLFAILDWLPKDELPSLTPYLRTKYTNMPDEAVREMSDYFQLLSKKYKISDGPIDGEDET